jgi:transcriptional regulator with XRE-family HTH domain
MTRQRAVPTEGTRLVLEVLGAQVRIERVRKQLTAAELGRRAGVGPRTVTAIERGNPAVSAGNLIEVALAAGVNLLGVDHPDARRGLAAIHREAVSLLPQRVLRKDLGDVGF